MSSNTAKAYLENKTRNSVGTSLRKVTKSDTRVLFVIALAKWGVSEKRRVDTDRFCIRCDPGTTCRQNRVESLGREEKTTSDRASCGAKTNTIRVKR